MLPQLLFGPVPYEPPVSLPEYTPDGPGASAGAGFRDLIEDITNISQVIVNKEDNTTDILVDDPGVVDAAQVPVMSAESLPLQDQLPLTDSEQVVEEPGKPVMNSLPVAALKPSDPAISGPVGGNRLPDTEAAIAISDRAGLLADPRAPGISAQIPDAPRPVGPMMVPASSPDPLQQSGLVPSRLAAPTAMQTALAAQNRSGDPTPQGHSVRADSPLADASGSAALISRSSGASSAAGPLLSSADRRSTDIVSRAEQRPVSSGAPGSTLAQVTVDELPATEISKPMKSASTGVYQSIDRDDRGYTVQRATDAVQSAAQPQASTNTPRQTAVDPLAAGAALMAAGANVSEPRVTGRSSLATRMTNLSGTAAAVAGDAIVKPESTVVGGTLQMPSVGGVKTADAGVSAPQLTQSTLTSAERTAGASHERLERRQNEFATLTTTASVETTRPESSVLRAEPSVQSAQIPAQLARHILQSHTQNLSELRMQLKPEELGQLDLKLRVEGERVHVVIVTQQPGVRELLESQLPQLRSLLQEGGFQLGDVDVRQDGGRSGDSPAEQTPDGASLAADLPDEINGSARADNRGDSSGLIDAFV